MENLYLNILMPPYKLIFVLKSNYRQIFSVFSELTLKFEKHYTPDIAIYPKRTVDYRQLIKDFAVPPLTVIEILSLSQTMESFEEKFETYFAKRVRSCWFVQPYFETIFLLLPDKNISVFHQNLLTDPATGITIDLLSLFSQNP
jgi:Uma2 family endonuclease